MSSEASATSDTATSSPTTKGNPATEGDSHCRANDARLDGRLKALNAYLQQAEETLDPLQTNIAYVVCDLLAFLSYYRQDLEEIRAEIPDPKLRIDWLRLVTEETSKLSKQFNALAQTSIRLDGMRQPPAADDGSPRLPKLPR